MSVKYIWICDAAECEETTHAKKGVLPKSWRAVDGSNMHLWEACAERWKRFFKAPEYKEE